MIVKSFLLKNLDVLSTKNHFRAMKFRLSFYIFLLLGQRKISAVCQDLTANSFEFAVSINILSYVGVVYS